MTGVKTSKGAQLHFFSAGNNGFFRVGGNDQEISAF
jgi:hypothetical protein